MANEGNELPTIDVVVPRRAEGRHSAEHNSVLDRVIEFAVRHLLSFPAAHIGRAGIHGLSVHRVAAAIVGMAGRTMIGPMLLPFPDRFGSDCDWISHGFVTRWDCRTSH